MAKVIISFDEIGGIGEFNGLPIHKSEPLIINKAADYLCNNWWHGIEDEDFINYQLNEVSWGNRVVSFHIELKGI